MRHLAINLAAVAPEKSDRLREVLAGLTLRLLGDETWICDTDPSAKEIRVSIGTMTILWCISHAYWKLHDRAFLPWMTGDGKDVILAEPPDLAAAMHLLEWAIEHWDSKDLEPGWTSRWPEGCPHPIENPTAGSDENVTDELALVAVGFFLHHELAHNYQQHTKRRAGIESVQQEQDADREAASWVLSGRSHDDAFFAKRALGIATALLAATALGIHTDKFGGATHPRDFDRLKHALDPYIPVPDHRVWQFAILPLKLHMDAIGLKVESRVYESGRDCFEHYLDVLAQHSERA
jgi:hypothetical protein